LILAADFPLEAIVASFPSRPMVEMPHISAFTFGGLLHPIVELKTAVAVQ
jgi:hypothetical protein